MNREIVPEDHSQIDRAAEDSNDLRHTIADKATDLTNESQLPSQRHGPHFLTTQAQSIVMRRVVTPEKPHPSHRLHLHQKQ